MNRTIEEIKRNTESGMSQALTYIDIYVTIGSKTLKYYILLTDEYGIRNLEKARRQANTLTISQLKKEGWLIIN